MKKITYLVLILCALIFLLPIAYTLSHAVMDAQQATEEGITYIPRNFNLNQFYDIAFFKSEYFHFFKNSLVITTTIILGQVLVGVIAGFAFAKLKFWGRDFIFMVYVLVILLPFQVTLVPNYLMFDKIYKVMSIQILDTHLSIILPGIFTSFGIFLLRQFIREIPDEIFEAARIDGASSLRIFFTVVLPLIKPAVFTLVILSFIDNWNMIEQAIIFIETTQKLPLSIYLEHVFYEDKTVFYGASVLYMIPAMFIFIKGHKYLSEGLVMGGK